MEWRGEWCSGEFEKQRAGRGGDQSLGSEVMALPTVIPSRPVADGEKVLMRQEDGES